MGRRKKDLSGCGTLTIKNTPGEEDYNFDSKEIIKKIDELKQAIINSRLKRDQYNLSVRKVKQEIPNELSKDITKISRKHRKGEILEDKEKNELKEYYKISKDRKDKRVIKKRAAAENILIQQKRRVLNKKVKEIINVFLKESRDITEDEKNILKVYNKEYPDNQQKELIESIIKSKNTPNKEPKETKELIKNDKLKEILKQKHKLKYKVSEENKPKVNMLLMKTIKPEDLQKRKNILLPPVPKELKDNVNNCISKYKKGEKLTEKEYEDLVKYNEMIKDSPLNKETTKDNPLKRKYDLIKSIINKKFEMKEETKKEEPKKPKLTKADKEVIKETNKIIEEPPKRKRGRPRSG